MNEREYAYKNNKLIDYHRFNPLNCDMHVHSESSNCSTRPINNIIDECLRNNVECVGIVDHLSEDNLESLKERKMKTSNLFDQNKLLIYYGVEIDFYEKNQKSYEQNILQLFDVILGAIHWLNFYKVNFFPETKPENKEKGLQPIDLRSEVISEIRETNKENFFDLYLGTISSMIKSKNIDIWAHPFRTLGFLFIYNENYLNYFMKEYFIEIIDNIYQNKIYFELNEGLNNSLLYRGGIYFTEKMQNIWMKFYSKVVKELLGKGIPLILGTDSHSQSVKIGGYSWIKKLLV